MFILGMYANANARLINKQLNQKKNNNHDNTTN
jgi:hypothetical protein